MSALLDPGNPAHATALRMLEQDLLAWIVTTTAEGDPRAVPVWFLWHEGRVAILTKPDAAKVAHVRRSSTVVVHLQAGGRFGDDVVILRGPARVSERTTAEWLIDVRETYETKDAEALEAYGSTLDEIATVFSTLIEVEPEHVSAW